jgi:hypothetical protein
MTIYQPFDCAIYISLAVLGLYLFHSYRDNWFLYLMIAGNFAGYHIEIFWCFFEMLVKVISENGIIKCYYLINYLIIIIIL